MKKLLTAVMLFAAPAAFAQTDASDVESKMKENAQKVENAARGGTKQEREQKKLKEQAMFEKGSEAFEVDGTVRKVERNKITLSRKDLPDVKLEIEDQTKIQVDGQQVTAGQLKDRLRMGDQVQARFQLDGDEPVALELKAQKSQGVGGSGK